MEYNRTTERRMEEYKYDEIVVSEKEMEALEEVFNQYFKDRGMQRPDGGEPLSNMTLSNSHQAVVYLRIVVKKQ